MEPPYPPLESQEERYSRAGIVHSRLENALSADTMEDALALTDDLLEYFEWEAKKAKQEGGGGGTRVLRSAEIEAGLRDLRGILDEIEHKAGEIVGFENKLGRNCRSQVTRAKEL